MNSETGVSPTRAHQSGAGLGALMTRERKVGNEIFVTIGARHYLQHEPRRRGLGQLGDGERLQFTEDRTNGKKNVPVQGAGPGRRL